MVMTTRALLFLVLSSLLVIGLVACGSDDAATPETREPTDVSGAVVKGPVANAQVSLHVMNSDGSPGNVVAGPVDTDGDGRWSLSLPADVSGTEFLVVASGGTYQDEASGADVSVTANLFGHLYRNAPSTVAVTPYTHLLHLKVAEAAGGTRASEAWAIAIADVSDAAGFGFDVTTTLPSSAPDASAASKGHMAYLGGLSQMVHDDPAYDGFETADPYGLAMAVVTDLIDGALDGQAGGNPISVDVGGSPTPLPVADADGAGVLGAAAQSYAQGDPDLSGAEVNTEPELPEVELPISQCDELRAAARSSLASALYAEINGPDAEAPRDVDLTAPRNAYNDLLACDGSDREAHFALALLDLTALAVDSEINAAFDEWEAYLDANIPFENTGGGSLAVPAGLGDPSGLMDLPIDAIHRSLTPYLSLQKAVGTPQLARVQDIFRNRVIPRLVSGIQHLDQVVSDPGFTFEVTPRMQGDLEEETREADYTDFLALRAAMKGLQAGVRIAISYKINMDEYTGAELLAAFDQTAGYALKLQGDGETQMQMVPGLLGGAVADLDAAIDALMAESDDQYDDLIKIGPDDLDEVGLLDFQATELAMMAESMTGPMTRTFNWDFEPDTPDVELTVDLHGFFTTPVADFKSLSPPYTFTVETVPYNQRWPGESYDTDFTATVPSAGTYSGSYQATYSDGGIVYTNDAPAWASEQLRAIVEAEANRIVQHAEFAGYLEVDANFYRSLDAGEQVIRVYVNTYYLLIESFVDVGLVTFDADTYAEWLAQWPDPTLGGLFPNVSDASVITEAFGMTADGWAKEFSLDWEYGSFGFDNYDWPVPPVGP